MLLSDQSDYGRIRAVNKEKDVIYEHPLNELIRVCLRLEQLLNRADHEVEDCSATGTRHTIVTIINLLQLLERPDLKAKLAKELSMQHQSLSRLERSPSVDEEKLNALLKKLDELNRYFITSSGKIAQELREIELLNNLRLHLFTPGGGCSFDTPLYHFWLQQPAEKRLITIKKWLSEFNMVRLASSLILKLVREASHAQMKNAINGFHQELLDPQTNLKMIRVIVPAQSETYPEISLSRHFLSIRFYSPSIATRPTQYQHSLPFLLSYCTT